MPSPIRLILAAALGAGGLAVPGVAAAAEAPGTCQGFTVTQAFSEGPDSIVVPTGPAARLPVLDLRGGADIARTRDFPPLVGRVGAVVCLGDGDNVFNQNAGLAVPAGGLPVPVAFYRVLGGAGRDRIDGGTLNDQLEGAGGDDIILGNGGPDNMGGGPGNDVMSGDAGDDLLFGDEGNDVLVGADGVDFIGGRNGDDRLFGGAGPDRLLGDNGNDIVSGGDGDDLMFGQAGSDNLSGGPGVDEVDGGPGFDICDAEIEINCEG